MTTTDIGIRCRVDDEGVAWVVFDRAGQVGVQEPVLHRLQFGPALREFGRLLALVLRQVRKRFDQGVVRGFPGLEKFRVMPFS